MLKNVLLLTFLGFLLFHVKLYVDNSKNLEKMTKKYKDLQKLYRKELQKQTEG